MYVCVRACVRACAAGGGGGGGGGSGGGGGVLTRIGVDVVAFPNSALWGSPSCHIMHSGSEDCVCQCFCCCCCCFYYPASRTARRRLWSNITVYTDRTTQLFGADESRLPNTGNGVVFQGGIVTGSCSGAYNHGVTFPCSIITGTCFRVV